MDTYFFQGRFRYLYYHSDCHRFSEFQVLPADALAGPGQIILWAFYSL